MVKYNAVTATMRTFEDAVRDVLDDESIDQRLTPGQMHAVIRLMYGEPAFKIAAMLSLNDNPKSKITLDHKTYISANVALHNMLYAPLQAKDTKPKQVEEFQMEFAWAAMGEGEGSNET